MKNQIVANDESYKDNLLRRLYKNAMEEYFTDITLIFGGNKTKQAHKIILAASLDVFSAMLSTNMKEKHEGMIDMSSSGLLYEYADDFLKFIYTGSVKVTIENVVSLLSCANFVMLESLQSICFTFLMNTISVHNCLVVAFLAKRFQYEKIFKQSELMVNQNFSLVSKTTHFLELDFDSTYELLSSDDIEVASEDFVFDALKMWIDHKPQERSKYFPQLMSCIRVDCLSPLCYKENLIVRHYMDLVNVKKQPRRCLDTSPVLMTTGGYDGNSCLMASFVFVHRITAWKHLASMKVLRHSHQTLSLNDRIFAIGGFNVNVGITNHVESYNPIRNEWQEMTPMHFKRKSFGATLYEGRIIVSRGLDGHYNQLNSVECFHDDVWQHWEGMNEARYDHCMVGCADGLFAIGGWEHACVERYNADRGWITLTPMACRRAGASLMTLHRKIFVFGGHDGRTCLTCMEVYDVQTDSWTRTAAPRMAARWRTGSIVYQNKLFIVGGRDSAWSYLDRVESYDFETGEWREESPLPCKVMSLSCSILNVPNHHIEK